MARKCNVTKKKPLVGYKVSHAHNKTKKRQLPNLQWKRVYMEEEGRWVRIRVSARALRTISRMGIEPFMRESGLSLGDLT